MNNGALRYSNLKVCVCVVCHVSGASKAAFRTKLKVISSWSHSKHTHKQCQRLSFLLISCQYLLLLNFSPTHLNKIIFISNFLSPQRSLYSFRSLSLKQTLEISGHTSSPDILFLSLSQTNTQTWTNTHTDSAASQMSKQWVSVLWSVGFFSPGLSSVRRAADSDKMVRLCLLVFTAGLLLEIEGLPAVTTEGHSGKQLRSRYGSKRQEAEVKYVRILSEACGHATDHQSWSLIPSLKATALKNLY